MDAFLACGGQLCYAPKCEKRFYGLGITLRKGALKPPVFDDPSETLLYTNGILVLHRRGDAVIPDASSARHMYNSIWADKKSGTPLRMAPALVRRLARAYAIANGIPLGLNDRFIGGLIRKEYASQFHGVEYTDWVHIHKTMCTKKGHACTSRLHRPEYPLDHITTKYGGSPLCAQCAAAIFGTPPQSWWSVQDVAERFDTTFVKSVILPMVKLPLKFILIGMVARQHVPANPQSIADYCTLGKEVTRHYGVMATRLVLTKVSSTDPFFDIAPPQHRIGIVKSAFAKQVRTKELYAVGLDTPHIQTGLSYLGWYHVPYTRKPMERIISILTPDLGIADDTLPLAAIPAPTTGYVVIESDAIRVLAHLANNPKTSVTLCPCTPDYISPYKRFIDAKTCTTVPLKSTWVGRAVVVTNAEYISWPLFLDIVRLGQTVRVYGNFSASLSGDNGARGIYADMVLTAQFGKKVAGTPLHGLISAAGGAAHRPLTDDPVQLKIYETEVACLRRLEWLLNPANGDWPHPVHPAWERGSLALATAVAHGHATLPAPLASIRSSGRLKPRTHIRFPSNVSGRGPAFPPRRRKNPT